jgi:hypothetical protein
LEYALGTDPAAVSSAPAARIVEVGGSQYLQIQWTRPNDRTDIIVTGEISPNLAPDSWSSEPAEVSVMTAPAGAGMETMIIRDLRPLSDQMRRFMRARISLKTP